MTGRLTVGEGDLAEVFYFFLFLLCHVGKCHTIDQNVPSHNRITEMHQCAFNMPINVCIYVQYDQCAGVYLWPLD